MEELIKHTNNEKTLYSQRGIGIATFLGSPLASSILIKHNFDELGDKRKGRITLIVGIGFTILMFVGIFSIPDGTIAKIPQQIIPAIYTAIIYYIVHILQGNDLKQYEDEGRLYKSNWKAAGIGAICLILIFGGIMAYAFLDPVAKAYDKGIQDFANNEESALKVYSDLNIKNSLELITEINGNSIPKWEQNIDLLDNLETKLELTQEMKVRNSKLKEYSNLRIEELGILKQAILLNTLRFDYQLDSLNKEMQTIIDELN